MGGVQIWLTDDNRRLIPPPEDPANPRWCPVSQQLITWAQRELLPMVAEEPSLESIMRAQAVLGDYYRWFYGRVDDEHRRDERHATHPCLHRAWMELWFAIDGMRLRIPIAKLFPSTQNAPAPAPRVRAPEEPFDELAGIIDGMGEFP